MKRVITYTTEVDPHEALWATVEVAKKHFKSMENQLYTKPGDPVPQVPKKIYMPTITREQIEEEIDLILSCYGTADPGISDDACMELERANKWMEGGVKKGIGFTMDDLITILAKRFPEFEADEIADLRDSWVA